jgi:hypothetical protein
MTVPLRLSRGQPAPDLRKSPARSDHAAASRRWFAALLWRAFPAPSERALREKAARALGVSERQVSNWLRCEHDASLRHVTAVILIAGAEAALARLEGRP